MLPAHVQIQNLLGMYAERLDAGDFPGVSELFAHARVTSEGTTTDARGAQEVLAIYQRATRLFPDDGTPHTKHVTTNFIVEVDEEAGTATCRSYFTVFQQTSTLPLQPIIQGRYHDRFERVDGAWRFAHRHIFSDRLGDLRQHLLPEVLEMMMTR